MDNQSTNDVFYNDLFQSIKKGLEMDPFNYKLYESLGKYYLLKNNPKQAFIAYSQAKFYCNDPVGKENLQGILDELSSQGYSVPKTAIVILSWNLKDYTTQCINSIRQTTSPETREIIVVDNGSTDGSAKWLQEQSDIIYQLNKENHGFPVGCNEGIALASEDADIFLLNNDTVLPPNALFWLQIGLYENDKVGSTGSLSNYVSNDQLIDVELHTPEEVLAYAQKTNVPMLYPYESKIYLVGFALLLKRTVLNQIGLLDERFSPGNAEDVDICLRIRQASYDNVLCRNSVILHFGSQSFQKMGDDYKSLMLNNIDKLCDKFGINIRYYSMPRKELVAHIHHDTYAPIRVLELGCGAGATLAWIKGRYPNAELHGIEIVPTAAKIADSIGSTNILCDNLETMNYPYEENYFDYCIMGDVLEHLHEPLPVLQNIYRFMKPDGQIIASMPNIKHWSVMIPLLVNDRLTYEDAGILDRTHLRMYTGTEIEKLVKDAGFHVISSNETSVGECPNELKPIIKALESFDRAGRKGAYEAYQYVVCAKKSAIKTELDDKKICFISAVNDENMYDKCLSYIHQLDVPEGYSIDTIAVREADSMTQAYNAAMNDSDAKYKIYLHQDAMIIDSSFILKMLNVFSNDESIGICGIAGASNLPKTGIWWAGRQKGVFSDSHEADEIMREYKFEYDPEKPLEVDVLDGVILCTQYDIPWRKDIFTGWHFYDLSQCFEFQRRNLKAMIIPAEHSMIEHYSGVASMVGFDEERVKFLNEYL